MYPPNTKPMAWALEYVPREHVGYELALIIGDVVHNFRVALDHLFAEIFQRAQMVERDRFPTHPGRKNLITAPVLDLIEKALPGAKDLFLNEIRPDNGPNEALWRFTDLDNDDKHNLLIPTVAIGEVSGTNIQIGGASIGKLRVRGDATHPITITHSFAPITVQGNFEIAVDVRFGQGGFFENEPVVPTLLQVGNLVEETIRAFYELIAKNPTGQPAGHAPPS